MKKTLAAFLVLCVMLSSLLPVGIVGAEDNKKETIELLAETFESGELGTDLLEGAGWNNWAPTITETDAQNQMDSKYSIAQDVYDADNKVGNFIRTQKTGSASMAMQLYKNFVDLGKELEEGEKPETFEAKSGLISIQYRLRALDNNSVYYVLCPRGTGSFEVQHQLGASGHWRYTNTTNLPKRVSGAKVGTDVWKDHYAPAIGTWIDFEVRIDFDAKEVTYIVYDADGNPWTGHEKRVLPDSMKSFNRLGIYSTRNGGVTAPNGGHEIDNIFVYSVGDLYTAKMVPTEDGALNKAKITFSNRLVKDTLATSSIAVDGATVTAAVRDKHDPRSFEITFDKDLVPETEYNVTVTGIEDIFGKTLASETIKFKTRDRVLSIDDAVFYTNYNAGTGTVADKLANGTYTAEIKIDNELLAPLNANMILVHKKGEKIVDAQAVDATTGADKENTVTAALTVSDAAADDKLEVYLWSGIDTMDALKPVKTLTASSIETESGYADSSAATDISMNASMNFEAKELTLEGAVAPAEKAEVTALVFDPAYKMETLTLANFKSAVIGIAQKASAADGSYSFEFDLVNPQDKKEYYAAVGADGKTVEKKALYVGADTVTSAITTVNGATADALVKMLSGEEAFIDSILLNDVLQMDLSVYNGLEDKKTVASALVGKNFADLATIRTAFDNAVTAQKAKEDKIAALLVTINDAVWGDLEEVLSNNDDLLKLDWAGDYADVKKDPALKAAFYKALADDNKYVFESLGELQDAFIAEAADVLASVEEEEEDDDDDDRTSSRPSKGFGGLLYHGSLSSKAPAPIVKEETNEIAVVDFDDLDTVPWAEESIRALAQEGVLAGVGGTKFAPNDTVTREQFVKMIVVAFGLFDENAQTAQFIDVSNAAWYGKYIASAVNSGIVYGVDNEHFGVGQQITRAEMATILYRAAAAIGKAPSVGDAITYQDAADIPEYALESIQAMTNAGVMSGVGENAFAPRAKATRAMAAKVIYVLRGAF